jgi:hypothetical protein
MRLKTMRSSRFGPLTLRRPPRFWGSPFWLWKKRVRCSLVLGTGMIASLGQTIAHMPQPMQALAIDVSWRIPVKVRYSLPLLVLRMSSRGIRWRM